MAALSLGDHGGNKTRLVDEGVVKPLVELRRFPNVEVQRSATLAVASLTVGPKEKPKLAVMGEEGLLPLIALAGSQDVEVQRASTFALGSLGECKEVRAKLVELGAVGTMVEQGRLASDIETRRNCGYFLAEISESPEFHDELVHEGGLKTLVYHAGLEDDEVQEYAAFSLAHVASNREYQVPVVKAGALEPLVSMMSVHAKPRNYAGLALLKLADNFECHLPIAEAGGVQALLRLARSKSSDSELAYKAALSVGHLATNAVRLLPKGVLAPKGGFAGDGNTGPGSTGGDAMEVRTAAPRRRGGAARRGEEAEYRGERLQSAPGMSALGSDNMAGGGGGHESKTGGGAGDLPVGSIVRTHAEERAKDFLDRATSRVGGT